MYIIIYVHKYITEESIFKNKSSIITVSRNVYGSTKNYSIFM